MSKLVRFGRGKLQSLALLATALMMSSLLPILLIAPAPIASASPDEKPIQENGARTFGNPSLPDWKDVIVENTADFVIVNNADNLIFKFRKGTAGYNEIWENDVQIVADERWVVEYLSKAPDTWKTRGIPQYVEWSQPENHHVIVKRFYRDWGSPETTFWVVYNFYGGFRPKISVRMEVGQEDNYRIVWKASGINKTYVAENFNYVRFWNEGENAIVFDYSDVYERFGDITEVEIEPWANNHKLNEYFYIGHLGIENFWLDPNFGYEGGPTINWQFVGDRITGSWFTAPEDGIVASITAYVMDPEGPEHYKFAIYRDDDVLVGYTEQAYGPQGDDWLSLDIVWGGSITEGVVYYLVAWGTALNCLIGYVDEAGKGAYDSETYGTWPDPWVPVSEDKKCWIYATYSPPEGPGAPVLTSPENNAVVSGTPVQYVWEKGADAFSHRLEIDNDDDWTNGVFDNITISGNGDDHFNDDASPYTAITYRWRVWAVSGAGETVSENTWYFTYRIPYKPVLLTPIDNTTTTDNTPTFTWVLGDGARWYRIEVDDDNDWTSGIVDNTTYIGYGTWTKPAPGYAIGTYYWRVWAINNAGENLSENTWIFTVEAPAEWQLIETWTGTINTPEAPPPPIKRLPKIIVYMPSTILEGFVETTTIHVWGTIYTRAENGQVWAQVLDNEGQPVNDATVTLTVWCEDGDNYLSAVSMTYSSGSNGIYTYDFTTPSVYGVYLCDVYASWTGDNAYGSGEFQVSEWAEMIMGDVVENYVGFFTVTIYDNATKQPLEDALVTLEKASAIVDSRYTREDGKAFLEITEWGVHVVRWSKEGYEERFNFMQIDLFNSTELSFFLEPEPDQPTSLLQYILSLAGSLAIGGGLMASVHYGSKKKAGTATLSIAFVLPIVLLACAWAAVI